MRRLEREYLVRRMLIAEWLQHASPIIIQHTGTVIKPKKRSKDFFGNTICLDCTTTNNLTKHHLTRKEKRLLKISAEKKVWIWLCRPCHDKKHNIKPRQKGRVVQQKDFTLTRLA